jgi:hypothetical protein
MDFSSMIPFLRDPESNTVKHSKKNMRSNSMLNNVSGGSEMSPIKGNTTMFKK